MLDVSADGGAIEKTLDAAAVPIDPEALLEAALAAPPGETAAAAERLVSQTSPEAGRTPVSNISPTKKPGRQSRFFNPKSISYGRKLEPSSGFCAQELCGLRTKKTGAGC
jgi:hypothetical protein